MKAGLAGEDIKAIRHRYLSLRRSISDSDRAAFSNIISEKLYDLIISGSYERILCFYPLWDEPQLLLLYERLLSEGRRLYFPISRDELTFFSVSDLDGFLPGAFNVMEPVDHSIPFTDEGGALAIIPGVCFDQSGGRIGFGKGYYDRFCSGHTGILKIGVCFRSCLYDGELTLREWDVPVDCVVTQ